MANIEIDASVDHTFLCKRRRTILPLGDAAVPLKRPNSRLDHTIALPIRQPLLKMNTMGKTQALGSHPFAPMVKPAPRIPLATTNIGPFLCIKQSKNRRDCLLEILLMA